MNPLELVSPARKSTSGMEFHIEAEIIEQRILGLIEHDPEGAARSWIGQDHLQKFGFLRPNAVKDAYGPMYNSPSKYPYHFELKDVLLNAAWIAAQLTAEEYYEGGEEATPFTPEAFADFSFDGKHVDKSGDPFATENRPNVTMEATVNGETVTYNLNPDCETSEKPKEGFKSLEAEKC